MRNSNYLAYLTSIFFALFFLSQIGFVTAVEGFYNAKSDVIRLSPGNFDAFIKNSNYTTIVEFYASWCGHCKTFTNTYDKVATSLKGVARVAAVQCDKNDKYKMFCQTYGIKGFPTVKVFKPGKKNPLISDYQGARTKKAIVSHILNSIENRVKKVNSVEDFNKFLSENVEKNTSENNQENHGAAILFHKDFKKSLPPLWNGLAIDFASNVSFAIAPPTLREKLDQFKNKDPFTMVVFKDSDFFIYDGEAKKQSMYEFIGKYFTPNEGSLAKNIKKEKSNNKKQKPSNKKASHDEL